jgi:hypothetical protein
MSDELNPMAREFLRSVEDADEPTRADYERVHGKVKVRLAAGIAAGVAALATSRATAAVAKVATATAAATSSVAPPAATIATVGTGTAIVGKIVTVVAVIAAVGGGTAAVVHYGDHAATSATPVASANTPTVVAQAAAPRAAPRPSAATAAPETMAPAPLATSSTSADLPRAPAPPAVQPPPVSPPAVQPTAAAPATSVVTAPSLDAEIALVRDARAALRGGDAGRSLAILDEHDRRFPGGALVEDCAAERVYALCALGDVGGARAAAARFLADHPYSPHAASVRASCGSAGGMN